MDDANIQVALSFFRAFPEVLKGMYPPAFLLFIASFLLALATGHSLSAGAAGTSVTTSVSSSISTRSGSGSTAQASVSGQNGLIVINGDRVEVKDGKLFLNGVSYGTVGERSVVKYTVKGNVKKLSVDGVARNPD
ncbi:MAG: hypothetical protein J5I81_02855 [Nitrococcus mobilis]|nr:hypothetical protein [Nitrococcus mobilis]